MNAYTNELTSTFRGHRAVVTRDGDTYDGYVSVFDFEANEVILHGAQKNGTDLGSVVVQYDSIERTDTPPMERVPVDAIEEAPYAVRSYDDQDMARYSRTIRDRGALFTFPTVRPCTDGNGYELLGGHKRTEASRRAGFETIPVHVRDISDRDALQFFIDEHFPLNKSERDDGSAPNRGWYDMDELTQSLDMMLDDWDESELRTFPQVAYWLDYDEPSPDPDAPTESEAEQGDEGGAQDTGEDGPRPRELVVNGRREYLKQTTGHR
jgi:hypothetical protein